VECGSTFVFDAQEQELFQTRGYTNEPKRCPSCREARRAERRGFGGSGYNGYQTRREMFPAVCAQCGKDTQVPFQPRQGRPVYCSDCFSRMQSSQRGSR